MANRISILILLITLGATHGRLKLRKNSIGVNVGFQLPAPGSRLLGALASLPFSVGYGPGGVHGPPPHHFPHHPQESDGEQPAVHHHHHHYGGPTRPEGVLDQNIFGHNSIGPKFGGFGNEIGYNEVYRR